MADPISFDKAAQAWTLAWDADWVTSVAFLGSSRRVAAGNNLGQILVWELPEKIGGSAPLPIRRLDGHTNAITHLRATVDGRWLISTSNDRTIRYWDMQAASKGNDTIALNARTIDDLKRRGGKLPAALSAKVELQESAKTLTGHKEWINGFGMSKDETLFVAGDDKGEVVVWDRVNAKELQRWQVKGWAFTAAISPDHKQVVVAERLPLVFDSGRHEGLKLYERETGKMTLDLGKDFKGQYIVAAEYSPDGKMLALARGGECDGNNGKVTLIDPAKGTKLRELMPGHLNGATNLAFHPDGKHLASTGRDTVVKIWNTQDGKLVKELGKGRGGQFKDWLHDVSFTPDGKWLAAADMDGAVQIWGLTGA